MSPRRLAFAALASLAAVACAGEGTPTVGAAGGAGSGSTGAAGHVGAGAAGTQAGVGAGAGTGGQAGAAGMSAAGAAGASPAGAAGVGNSNNGTAGVTGAGGGTFSSGVRVHLQRTFTAPKAISFGLPVPPGALKSAASVRVTMGGAPVAASVKALLSEHDASGAPTGVRAVLIQLPATVLSGDAADVDVAWSGAGSAPAAATMPFTSPDVSADSPEVVRTAARTIQASGGVNKLVESPPADRTLFTGREPRVLATFPDGYLAATGILGRQSTATAVAGGDLAGLSFFSEDARNFGVSALYGDAYAVNPAAVVDPVANFEGWLYDRCATFLTFYSHTGDARFLRHAYRSCSYYAGKIGLTGATSGIFTGKADSDTKYSHLRGLYVYYALTGDESALAAGKAIAALWLADTAFVGPYRMGHLRSADHLWTERLLGTSLEGLYYGHRLTGEAQYLTAFREMLDTATRHITGDAAALAAINPGVGPFPPQSCFIHSAAQQAEGSGADPWCSTWMSELTIDSLLQYQAQTNDPRVDEIFVRLVRFLRDVGSQYISSDVQDDTFLHPKVCYDAKASSGLRRLAPLYGSGLDGTGKRRNFGLPDDVEHCADATALTAAGIRALVRQGKFDAAGGAALAPFKSEGESFVALHHELAACARATFDGDSRLRRDPASWTSAQLAAGVADPATFIANNLIGYPKYPTSPQRKLSWWFNSSMLQFGLLAEAGIKVPALSPGRVQPATCP
jgi:hypothetical protein